MKVLNLQCAHQHAFEGWFASEDDFQSQRARQLVACPICGDTTIAKLLSAPRLNLGAQQPDPPARQEQAPPVPAMAEATLQAAWLKMVRHVMAHTEDVGSQFAEEARKIHYGEADDRNIRGQASREETQALLDEGIAVLPLPVPAALKGPVH
jgi:hypothetical protein